jgi:hypothetical protein
MPRLVEYHDPSDSDSQWVRNWRTVFLQRVAHVAPEVLTSLADAVLPAFRAAWEESQPFVRTHFFLRGRAALDRIPDELRGPSLPTFGAALDAWANRWHLSDAWILDAALSTLRLWTTHPEKLAGPLYWWDPWGAGAPQPTTLTLHWSPITQEWADFEEAALKELERYRIKVERWAREQRLKRAPEKRARRDGDAGLHFEWLARWQVQGWPHLSSAVEKAVKETAALIGLTLRQ